MTVLPTPSESPTLPPLAALRRFVRRNPEAERCELCGAELPPEHQHLLEPPTRRLLCSCDAFAILFHGQASARYRRVPRTTEFLSGFRITDSQWESLHLPINLAFFFFSSPANRVVALFPSPAGATESLLTLESWRDLVADNPVLGQLETDVEALLVNRIEDRREYVRLPIDQCFKLVGMIRTHWHGLSGGEGVRNQIDQFFAGLRANTTTAGDIMPDLNFAIEKAEAVEFAAAPMLHFSLRITDAAPEQIHAVALRCQIRIEPGRRSYEPTEKERLLDLFGVPSRWGQTLKPMLWTHTGVMVPPFSSSTIVDLPVPCTQDFNIAAARFFYALENGEVPLNFLFSGTIFYAPEGAEARGLQITQISWEKEASFRLPVSVWKRMMDMYYPNSAWLCLPQDAFDKLARYKSEHMLPTWEAAIEKLLSTGAARLSGPRQVTEVQA